MTKELKLFEVCMDADAFVSLLIRAESEERVEELVNLLTDLDILEMSGHGPFDWNIEIEERDDLDINDPKVLEQINIDDVDA